MEALGYVKAGTYADDRQTTLRVDLLRWLEGQQLARKQRTYESYAEAEADGNRTRQRRSAALTGLKTGGATRHPDASAATLLAAPAAG